MEDELVKVVDGLTWVRPTCDNCGGRLTDGDGGYYHIEGARWCHTCRKGNYTDKEWEILYDEDEYDEYFWSELEEEDDWEEE